MNGRPAKGRKLTKKEATIKEKLLRSKLLNVAQNEGIYYQTILTRYFQERLIYRISQTSYRQNFYLKGGALCTPTRNSQLGRHWILTSSATNSESGKRMEFNYLRANFTLVAPL